MSRWRCDGVPSTEANCGCIGLPPGVTGRFPAGPETPASCPHLVLEVARHTYIWCRAGVRLRPAAPPWGQESGGRAANSTLMDALERLRARITALQPRDLPPHSYRRAAVLIPVFRAREVPTVLLTRRTETVERHKGQIAFPGGGEEPGDQDLRATALRETQEEIGLSTDSVAVWGRLDEVETVVSGFAITPYVGFISWPLTLTPNPNEIAEILTVPLTVFLEPANLRIEQVMREGRPFELLFYDYPPYVIWGVTARIIHGMVDLLQGNAPPGHGS